MPDMPEPESLATIRAAVEAILPSGIEVGADRRVAELVDVALPGFPDMMAALLDAFAMDVRPGAAFRELSLEERGRVIRAMSSEESQDIRDAIDGIFVFSVGAVYSEWSGYDPATETLTPPASWERVGFRGPSRGHPDYRVGI